MNNVGSTTLLHPVFNNLEQIIIFRRVLQVWRNKWARWGTSSAISYPEPAIFRGRIESSGIIHNRKPEILAFLLDCYIPFCINNQSDSPRFMDYPRALDSSPEDRGLGVRDCFKYVVLMKAPGYEADVRLWSKRLSPIILIGVLSSWPISGQADFTSHVKMQISYVQGLPNEYLNARPNAATRKSTNSKGIRPFDF